MKRKGGCFVSLERKSCCDPGALQILKAAECARNHGHAIYWLSWAENWEENTGVEDWGTVQWTALGWKEEERKSMRHQVRKAERGMRGLEEDARRAEFQSRASQALIIATGSPRNLRMTRKNDGRYI